jgi:hypothetical protein
MPETDKQLFVITASNPEASNHVAKSIAGPIDPVLCQQHFQASVLDELYETVRTESSMRGELCPGKGTCPIGKGFVPGTMSSYTRVVGTRSGRPSFPSIETPDSRLPCGEEIARERHGS